MSNICFWEKADFLKTSILFKVQKYYWILKLLLQIKNQVSESKSVCGFPNILILKEIMTF